MDILYNCLRVNTKAKRFTACTLVTLLLFNCAPRLSHYREYESKLPVTISDRVGDAIDATEREKFDLLHGIEDFVYAEYYSILDGGYAVEITTDDAVYKAVDRDERAVEILRDYINRNEEIRANRKQFEEKWNIVGYDTLGQPITRNEVNAVRLLYAGAVGGVLAGAIAFVPSVLIGLWACGYDLFTGCERSEVFGYAGFFSVFLLSIYAGASLGNKIDRGSALGSIRKAREPIIVE